MKKLSEVDVEVKANKCASQIINHLKAPLYYIPDVAWYTIRAYLIEAFKEGDTYGRHNITTSDIKRMIEKCASEDRINSLKELRVKESNYLLKLIKGKYDRK